MYKFLLFIISSFFIFYYSIAVATEVGEKVDGKLINELADYGIYKPQCEGIVDRLVVLRPEYYGFDGKIHKDGEIIVLDATAKYVAKIFDELLEAKFAIYGIDPVKEVIADRTVFPVEPSIGDDYNYSNSFCCRKMVGSEKMSLHSFGVAIDLNPLQNPYVGVDTTNKVITEVIPKDGIMYLNRYQNRPDKPFRKGIIDQKIEDIFKRNGFTIWGGNWDYPLDYQHFQLSRPLTDLLIAMSPEDAKRFFDYHVQYFNKNSKEIVNKIMSEMRADDTRKVIALYENNKLKFWEIVNITFNN